MSDFTTAGPVRSDEHYCIPPLDRLNLNEVLALVRKGRYFVLHAPRQTGKTSVLLTLRDLLNDGTVGDYRCAYATVEPARAAGEDIARATGAILGVMAEEAHHVLRDSATADLAKTLDPESRPYDTLKAFLTRWAAADRRPLVLLIDDMDALVGDTLISVLRQLRAGYVDRPERFPQSVVLCGIHDVRDYNMHAASAKGVIPSSGVFNIKAKSIRLGDFTEDDVRTLLGQHTAETGQSFTLEAVAAVWDQTRGQPWLVNALAKDICLEHGVPRLRDRPLTECTVLEACEALIQRRETHLDQLADTLREPRVRRVIEPLMSGEYGHYSGTDLEYARDVGLVAPDPPARIANPIYREILAREPTCVS